MRVNISPRQRFKILERDGFKCQYCGATSANAQLHIDHVHPVSQGGRNEPTNLITACRTCNAGKAGRPLRCGPRPGLLAWSMSDERVFLDNIRVSKKCRTVLQEFQHNGEVPAAVVGAVRDAMMDFDAEEVLSLANDAVCRAYESVSLRAAEINRLADTDKFEHKSGGFVFRRRRVEPWDEWWVRRFFGLALRLFVAELELRRVQDAVERAELVSGDVADDGERP